MYQVNGLYSNHSGYDVAMTELNTGREFGVQFTDSGEHAPEFLIPEKKDSHFVGYPCRKLVVSNISDYKLDTEDFFC